MSRSSSPAEASSAAIRHVCPEIGSTACRASNRSSLTDIRGMRIKHMTTASVIAVAMDTLTVPRRTPKYAFARTTIESRIQTRLEKSSKTIFYAIGQQFPERQRRNESIAGTSCSLSWPRRHPSLPVTGKIGFARELLMDYCGFTSMSGRMLCARHAFRCDVLGLLSFCPFFLNQLVRLESFMRIP
jgi:hypothetical protein